MTTRHRSLFRRLLFGFLSVMLGIWLCALAWDLYETRTTAKALATQETKGLTRNVMVFMQTIADRPDDMRRVAQRIEQVREDLFKERGLYPDHVRIQVWKGPAIVYASSPDLPTSLPTRSASNYPPASIKGSWVNWTESDPASGITVRITQEVTGTWLINDIASIGYYFLPLLYSFPFLLLPAWFIIRHGLRPLKSIVAEIEERSASDLSPLVASPYQELSPLVSSVNRLMGRLTERMVREQEFLIDAAHELKTPLAVIQINADSMVNNRAPQRVQEAAAGLQQGVARATHMVHQLLALARSSADREQVELQKMDLVELVRDRLASAAQIAWQRAIEIELQSPETCLLPLHRESMASLIDNLINNAVKYSPDRARVVVCVTADAHGVQLRVADEGPGIPATLRKKVFERFFRLPGQDQAGSGLGLAIAERAAAQNHATIRLDVGSHGGGLEVIVDFPVEGREAPPCEDA